MNRTLVDTSLMLTGVTSTVGPQQVDIIEKYRFLAYPLFENAAFIFTVGDLVAVIGLGLTAYGAISLARHRK